MDVGSARLESWDGSTIVISVVATNETGALKRAQLWANRNVARMMEPVSGKPQRVNSEDIVVAAPINRYYYKFGLMKSS